MTSGNNFMVETRQVVTRHAAAIAGMAFYCAGILALLMHASAYMSLSLRLAGLLLLAWAAWRRRSLMAWIFWAMIAGGQLGVDAPAFAVSLRVFSDIFLRLIKTIVAPLILGTLITGIAAHGQMRSLGRMGLKALIYFEVLTTVAMLVGLGAINITRAGVGLAVPQQQTQIAQVGSRQPDSAGGSVRHLVRSSHGPAQRGESRTPAAGDRVSDQHHVFLYQHRDVLRPDRSGRRDGLHHRPDGTGCFASSRPPSAHALCGARCVCVPVRRFLRAVAEPATIAFATSTSEAALPRAMEAMEALGVPRRIVAFVIPAGYSFNLDGSTLYLALASVFVAQAAGVTMSWKQQLFMVGTLMLTSKGVAGVPRATLIVLLATVAMFHLPEEPIFVILGIDALMDMARTTVNVVGNCLASVVVARWEGEFGKEQPAVETMDALP
jgi:proton glutamate symport protein